MKTTIYEIYVDGLFEEAWENKVDAATRALNIEDELGIGRVRLMQNDYCELFDWEEV